MSPPRFLDLARRFEPLQAEAMRRLAVDHAQVADASLTFASPTSFVNKAVGLGLERAPSDAELDALDAFFATRGTEPKIELTVFAEDALLRRLADRGYVLREIETLLVRALGAPPAVSGPADLRIEPVPRSDEDALRRFAAISWSGFLPEGATIPEEQLEPTLASLRGPESDAFVAWVGDAAAGAASASTMGGVTTLFGTSVLPAFRRRGIQQALMAARLAAGARRGADLAAIVSKPGIPTERNALRLGFEVGYSRLVFVRRGDGLASAL